MSDDARLRRIWAAVPAEGEHPDEGTWELFACGELEGDERARLMTHVSTCAPCAGTYRALLALAAEARILDPSLPAPSLPPREPAAPARRRRPALWAASFAFAAAAAVVLAVSWPRARPDVMRGGGDEAAVIELALPAPAHASWPAVAGADGYRVTVFTEDGRPVWTTLTAAAATEATWPEARAGGYRFVVEALHGGKIVARSRLTPFVVPR